ncbi:MAG: hypothetical protein RR232_07595 [Clostridia bacterium]
MSLLEKLAEQLGCEYISQLPCKHVNQMQIDYIRNLSETQYAFADYVELAKYVLRDGCEYSSIAQIKAALIKKMTQQ